MAACVAVGVDESVNSELKQHDEVNMQLTRDFGLLPFQARMFDDLVSASPDGMLILGN